MPTMIRAARPKVKSARRTTRPAAPFGQGLTYFTPYAVVAADFTEPSDEDRAAAAAMFARDDEGDDDGFPYDLLAAEAEGYDRVVAGCYA